MCDCGPMAGPAIDTDRDRHPVRLAGSGPMVLAVTSGRALAEAALREPMQAVGWRPRAAGWFTQQIAAGFLGVTAVGSASRYSRPGTAQITLYVGIREEATEQAVSELCSVKDQGYRQRTATGGIGYLLPGSSWRTWEITPGNAMELARQLTALVQRHAVPYLHQLSSDRAAFAYCHQAIRGLRASRGSVPGRRTAHQAPGPRRSRHVSPRTDRRTRTANRRRS